ncbi:helix-turn-helix transcriptional regulator [Spongiactinospora sp. TRM90649]|uniref:helix-turn-helix domain-containing protein n=1 Tax=Spongiactinospora sp. TRM90649 TaxID=3031114 RepID=UPI0023F92744|nr:helix-turn-helix transcriptional regulator [Spongiactinospora sp. TRM90649]MDF5758812.1 helix-turn-helix transcriptional regulator [Spongiactinospora sp. TRM90649]
MTYSPTVRRRRLSSLLRQLRQSAGFHADEVARRLEWTASKLTRMERNEWKLPSVRDVRDLLDVYGVTDKAQREAVITLAREARQRGWWEEYKDVFELGSVPEFEAEAAKILTFQALLVPGLLQTADYAAAVFRGGQVVREETISRRVEARMARQQILEGKKPPILWAVIDEAALTKHVGGVAVMRQQLLHIAKMAERPNIGVQVIPHTVGAHAAAENSFTILEFATPDDPSIVNIGMITGDLYLEKPEEVRTYVLAYDHVRASALSADASLAYLAGLAEQLQ